MTTYHSDLLRRDQSSPPRRLRTTRVRLSCTLITTEGRFAALEPEWRLLHAQAAYRSAFNSWEWVSAWWRHLGPVFSRRRSRPQLHVICVRRPDGRLVGIAPFYETPSPLVWLGCRHIKSFSSARAGEGMTEDPPLLLHGDHEEEALEAILSFLVVPVQCRWCHFYLPVLSGRTFPSRPPRRRAPFSHIQPLRQEEGPQVVPLPPSWQAFRATLHRSMRDNLAYYPRRLTRHGHQWTVRTVRDVADCGSAVETLIALHHRRSLSPRGPSHADHMPTAAHQQCVKEVLCELCRSGSAFIALLEIDGVTVAAQAFLEVGTRLTVYYSGYDPAWYDYSPLTILLGETIKDAIGRQITELNFLRGAAGWKSRWGTREEMPYQRLTSRWSSWIKSAEAGSRED